MPGINLDVKVKSATLAYTNTASKRLFTLPPGSVILGFYVNVDVAFNSSGTDLIDLGDSSSATYYADDVEAGTAQTVIVQQSNLGPTGNKPKDVFGKYIPSVADASAGHATVYVQYAAPFNS